MANAVTRLTLTRFRCYERVRLVTDPVPVVLTGRNGAGKTNLLESLSLLVPGRGLRRARMAELERTGSEGGWAVAATVETRLGPVEIGTGSRPGAVGESGERRVVRIDGQTERSQTALADHLSMIWLTPQMDRLFLEGSSGRRHFLDRLAFGFDPAHAGRLTRFERGQRERARLLRAGNFDDAWLSALEEVMATSGVAVSAARRDLVARLGTACAQATGPFPRPLLGLAGPLEERLASQPALMVEDWVRERLRAARRDDAESGGAVTGPHRADLEVRFHPEGAVGGRGVPAALCSTGEQKALLIAIVLANARLMAAEPLGPPILLLDEVAAHLDAWRRGALFEEIVALGCQAWLTGTDAALFAPLGRLVRHFHIEAAQITPVAV